MSDYYQLPRVVKAYRVEGDNRHYVAARIQGFVHPNGVAAPSPRGRVYAHVGEWLVRGERGFFEVFRDSDFQAMFRETFIEED